MTLNKQLNTKSRIWCILASIPRKIVHISVRDSGINMWQVCLREERTMSISMRQATGDQREADRNYNVTMKCMRKRECEATNIHSTQHRTVWGTHWEEICQRQEWEKWVWQAERQSVSRRGEIGSIIAAIIHGTLAPVLAVHRVYTVCERTAQTRTHSHA